MGSGFYRRSWSSLTSRPAFFHQRQVQAYRQQRSWSYSSCRVTSTLLGCTDFLGHFSTGGVAFAPMTALRVKSGCMSFLNDGFGSRYLAAFLTPWNLLFLAETLYQIFSFWPAFFADAVERVNYIVGKNNEHAMEIQSWNNIWGLIQRCIERSGS